MIKQKKITISRPYFACEVGNLSMELINLLLILFNGKAILFNGKDIYHKSFINNF